MGLDAVSWNLYTQHLILSFIRLRDKYDSFKWSKNIATYYFTAKSGYREKFVHEIGEKGLVVKAHLEGESSDEKKCLHVAHFSQQSVSGRYCRNGHGKVLASFHFARVIEKLFLSNSYTVHI